MLSKIDGYRAQVRNLLTLLIVWSIWAQSVTMGQVKIIDLSSVVVFVEPDQVIFNF